MSGYEIGISGLHASQWSMDIIGNNIANAATEGYHRQDIDFRPASETISNNMMIGQGVDFQGVIRRINQHIEEQILRQDTSMSSLNRQMDSLRSIESAFAELSTPGISTALDKFYSAFHDLSVRTGDVSLQSAVVSAAQTLSNQFRNVASVMTNLEDITYSEARTTVDKINELSSQIAQMNGIIYSQKVTGYDASNMMDQRDRLVIELNKLAGVQVTQKNDGQVDLTVSNIPLVNGSNNTQIEANLIPNGTAFDLAVSISGTEQYDTNVTGGSLGGLFALRNDILREISSNLDTLAQTIISETNKLHVQGIGKAGSFTSLTGWTMSQNNVSDFVPPVSPGSIFVRVTAPNGSVTRHEVVVSSASTLQSVANDFASITGLDNNTGLNSGRLQIVANSGYTFDFLPGALSTPTAYSPNPLAGAGAGAGQAPPSIQISGYYTGSANQDYTCTVTAAAGTQAVGTGTMTLTIVDGSGSTVDTVNIGQGYGEGENGREIILENGLKITLNTNGSSPGYFNDGDQFTINALASSDTSGFLAAVGINCFFSGIDASSVALNSDVVQSSDRIASSRSDNSSGHENAVAISQLGDALQTSLGNMSIKDYYRTMTVDVGNQISFTQMQYDNAEGISRSLAQQRDAVSGVDMNDQAMQMMIYERLFQSMAKYLNTISSLYQTMQTIIS